MNPYHQANWQYGYTLGPSSEATSGAYATYYAGAAAAAYGAQPNQQPDYRNQNQRNMTHTNPAPTTTASPAAASAAGNAAKPSSWQQLKQELAASVTSPAASQAKPYYPTKMFVKASSTPSVGGNQNSNGATTTLTSPATSNNSGGEEAGTLACMKLHEVAVQNKIVEVYEKITTELAPGIHGVRLKFGTEVFTGTGANFKAAKQNAASTALAQTKYPKPLEKKTMKVRPHGITATQELHELATKKGKEARFKFLEPPNFEFKSSMRLWSKEEMRGNYRVQLTVNNFDYYGQADLPQQAKHNAAIQALPMLNRIPDAASASKAHVVIPAASDNSENGANGVKSEPGASNAPVVKNVIMTLNEIAMSQNHCMEWTMVREDGPPHARKFTWSLTMGPYVTEGIGCSKKVAKSLAAQAMYEKIPMEWKTANGSATKKRKNKPKKRKAPGATDETAEATTSQTPTKKAKETADPSIKRPAYSVIQATNPISALYEYCRKVKAPDPDFECVAENVLETWQKENHTFKKTEYTLKLEVNGSAYYASANTKKAAKTAVATEAWNIIRVEHI